MATCKCLDIWMNSWLKDDRTLQVTLDGRIEIDHCDPQTGTFTGKHYDQSGVYDGDVSGQCQSSNPHIRFSRDITIAGGVTQRITYHGNIREASVLHPRRTIINGRYKKVPPDAPKAKPLAAADDGDWSAQGQVTLAAATRKRKR